MKRIFISTVLFIIIATVAIIGTSSIDYFVKPIIYELETSILSYKNNDKTGTSESILNAVNMWTDATKFLTITLRHDEIDNIDLELCRISTIADIDIDNTQFEIECRELIFKLYHLISKEKLNIKNVF